MFLVYGNTHVAEGMSMTKKILGRMFPESEKKLIIINNKATEAYRKTDDPIWEISGDNRLSEFTGWDHGYAFAKSALNLTANDLILFANDTFFRRSYREGGRSFLDFFNRPLIEGHDLTAESIGYLDDFPRDVELMGIRYRQWIRSNILFLPFNVCERLGKLTFPLPESEIFSSAPETFWSDSDKISDNWKAYISSWLFGTVNPDYPEYQLHWHSSQPVNHENFSFFKKKARAILSEHFLSARLFAMNCPIIDANFFEKLPDRHIAPYYS
ncbi:hypothetical protein C9I57_12890 [Trinickia symbiotica]|uniref:Uncharacterized protein n=1 Tax=Trinickia symbiotica TaxID=863227 RepID=A0A2T3XW08_9BURK|nr:hypothetical protein [Trinickia symbiotica]PTB20709.1 hypothetical protein C9I57_12890 [Trinickia symbiotica]